MKTLLLALAVAAYSAGAVSVHPRNDGRALVNPGMGLTMHFYSNAPNYGTRLGCEDDMSWFPGCSVIYLRLPWQILEPEEGFRNWTVLDTPAQRWIRRGGQVAIRVTCSEDGRRFATPEWVKKAGAKGREYLFKYSGGKPRTPDGSLPWDRDLAEDVRGAVSRRGLSQDHQGGAFVGAHWGHEDDTGAYLKAHAKDIDMSKLFFHVQHPHPPRTVYSPGRTDKSILRNDLSRYSNCFSLSGHGHESAAYETALWQGSFTALGGSSTKSPVTLAPRENGGWVLRMRTPQPITPTVDAGRGSHAMIVSVYAHELVVERHEFVYDEPLGEEWVLPLPLETHPEGPCVIAARAEAPRFADDAQLTVERCRTKTRQKETVEAFRAVSPPAIPAKHHGRVTDYRVEVLDGEGGPVVATRLLMQPRLTLSERQLGSDVTIACLIPCAEIVGVSDPVFTVSPLNAGGKGGSPLIARSNPARKAH